MRKDWAWILIVLVSLLVGCSSKSQDVVLVEVESIENKVVENEIEKIDEVRTSEQITDSLFMDFFNRYFSLSLEERLILNQNPIGLDEEDKVIYQTHMIGLKELLFPYLSEDAQLSLQSTYKNDNLHLPKLLEINNYITIGTNQVESTHIVSARPLGEHMIYEIEVVTREKVIDIVEANKRYVWDENKKYYTYKEEAIKEENLYTKKAFETAYNIENELEASYLFLQETPEDKEDEIRLVHRYWVEIIPGEALVVESVEEASGFVMQEAYRQKASANQYVSRMSYPEKDNPLENIIKEVLTKLLSKPKAFFKYYEQIFQEDYQSIVSFWDTLDSKEQMIIPKQKYKNAYHTNLNPYKDNVEKIDLISGSISMKPSVYGTKKQPRWQVSVPMKILRKDNQSAYYIYDYLVGCEGGKIEFIHFLEIREMALEEYERLTIE